MNGERVSMERWGSLTWFLYTRSQRKALCRDREDEADMWRRLWRLDLA